MWIQALRACEENATYWQAKIARNCWRNERGQAELAASGWRVFVTWECELKDDLAATLERIRVLLENPDHRLPWECRDVANQRRTISVRLRMLARVAGASRRGGLACALQDNRASGAKLALR